MQQRRTLLLVGLATLVAAFLVAWRTGLVPIGDDDAAERAPAAPPEPLGVAESAKDGRPGGLAGRPAEAAAMGEAVPAAAPVQPTGIAYRGIVTDEDGKPLAGATVRPDVSSTRRGVEANAQDSGADGRVAFTIAKTPRYLWVRATLLGRVQRQGETALEVAKETPIVLVPSCPLRVRVLDGSSSAPVAGVRLRVVSGLMVRALFAHGFDGPFSDEQTTNADGKATLGTEGGPAILYVAPSDDHGATTVRGLTVPREGIDIEVPLFRGGTLLGRVTDTEGAPVRGAIVRLDVSMAYRRDTTTNGDGRYRLEGVSFDRAALEEARFEPYARLVVHAAGLPTTFADPTPLPDFGETSTTDIAMEIGARIEGQVVDAEGRPAAATWLHAEWTTQRDASGDSDLDVPIGPDGRFALGPLAAGMWTLTVRDHAHDRTVGGARQVVAAGQVVTGVEIRLADRSGAVTIRVVDAHGAPVAATSVSARALVGNVLDVMGEGTTGADGVVRIDGIPKGQVTLALHPPESTPFGLVPTADELAGAKELLVTLAAGEASGKALRLDGTPAHVRLHLSGSVGFGYDNGPTVETGADGSFRFRYIPTGRAPGIAVDDEALVLLGDATAVAGRHGAVVWVADRSEVARYHVSFLLRDAASGAPIPAVAWKCEAILTPPGEGDGGRFQVRAHGPDTDPAGRFLAFQPVAPGTYDVRVVAPGYRVVRLREFRIPWTGDPTTLRFERGASVEGTVLDGDGKPVEGATVSVGGDQDATTDARGHYVVAGLEEGSAEARVTGDFVESSTSKVAVPASGTASLDLRVARAAALRVVVDGISPGRESGRAEVEVTPAAGGAAQTHSFLIDRPPSERNTEGLFFAGLRVGRVRVVVRRDGRSSAPVEISTVAGETASTHVPLP